MEQKVVRWVADVIGYPETCAGSLQSGGTLSNLTAILTAREAADLKLCDYERYKEGPIRAT